MSAASAEFGNDWRQAVRRGQTQLGMFCSSYSAQTTEVVAGSGIDFLIFDHEHTPWSWPELHVQLAVLRAFPVAAVVRVATLDAAMARQLLDLGVDAVMVANVESAAAAQHLVSCLRYAPRGTRGMGGSVRASRYGRAAPTRASADAQASLWVQIESRQGLAHARDIAGVDGVDAVFFGPHDLAVDLGYWGQPGHAEVVAALQGGVAAVTALGVTTGILAPVAEVAHWHRHGVRLLASGSDLGLLAQAADRLVQQGRQQVQEVT